MMQFHLHYQLAPEAKAILAKQGKPSDRKMKLIVLHPEQQLPHATISQAVQALSELSFEGAKGEDLVEAVKGLTEALKGFHRASSGVEPDYVVATQEQWDKLVGLGDLAGSTGILTVGGDRQQTVGWRFVATPYGDARIEAIQQDVYQFSEPPDLAGLIRYTEEHRAKLQAIREIEDAKLAAHQKEKAVERATKRRAEILTQTQANIDSASSLGAEDLVGDLTRKFEAGDLTEMSNANSDFKKNLQKWIDQRDLVELPSWLQNNELVDDPHFHRLTGLIAADMMDATELGGYRKLRLEQERPNWKLLFTRTYPSSVKPNNETLERLLQARAEIPGVAVHGNGESNNKILVATWRGWQVRFDPEPVTT